MARKKQNELLPPPIELSTAAKSDYVSYWTALAANGEIPESRNLVRTIKGQGGSNNILRFPNLISSPKPFSIRNGYISPREVLEVCIAAYWHDGFALWRQTVEKMVELSNSNIILNKSSKKTRDFVSEWLKQIQADKFAARFFRERWRSGNIFILSLDGQLQPEDIKQLNQLYTNVDSTIPLRYSILEPQRICAKVGLNYDTPIYFREYSPEETKALINPQSEIDKAIVNNLPEETKKLIKDSRGGSIILPIDPKNLSVVLVKNQNYEPFAVPMVWNALQNIELKLALQNMDKVIANFGERIFLLINVGMKNDEYNQVGMNYNTMAQLQQMFNSGAVQRAIVVDFSVKMQWVTLPINELLSEQKYKQVDKDLLIALNSVFFSEGEKFSNTSIKVNIFIETLKEARNEFISFMQKEVDKLCKKINAKSSPELSFSEVDLRDKDQYVKILQSMYSVGLLTAEEFYDAVSSGKLPSKEESIESQNEFKKLKEEGLYQPIVGNSVSLQEEQMALNQELGLQKIEQSAKAPGSAGRPAGTKAKQTTKKVSPRTASGEAYYLVESDEEPETKFSFAAIKEISWKVSNLHSKIEGKLGKPGENVARVNEVVENIIATEPDSNKWDKLINKRIKSLAPVASSVSTKISEIEETFKVSRYAATILNLAIV